MRSCGIVEGVRNLSLVLESIENTRKLYSGSDAGTEIELLAAAEENSGGPAAAFEFATCLALGALMMVSGRTPAFGGG